MKEGLFRKSLVLTIICFFIGAGIVPSINGITTSRNQSYCAVIDDTLDQEQTETEDNLEAKVPFGEELDDKLIILAQSFKPTLPVLSKVDVLLRKKLTDLGVMVSIRESVDGSDLVSIYQEYSEIETFPDWTTFDFDDIDVIPEQTYYIVCSTNASALTFRYEWHWGYRAGELVDNYPRGKAYIYQNDIWTDQDETDFCFKTYGKWDQPPVARFKWTPTKPTMNTDIWFDASDSHDPDGTIKYYEWDWENDGVYDENNTIPTATYRWSMSGNYSVTLRVIDDDNFNDTVTMWVKIWTIVVPTDVPTIQQAVDLSEPGYNIIVKDNTYSENVLIDVEMLTLTGENKENTFIDGGGRDHVITVTDNAYGVNISGFTIQNSGNNNAGIYVSSEYSIIEENIITNNDEAMRLVDSGANQIHSNTIEGNTYGIVLDENTHGNIITGNIFTGNTLHGIWIRQFSSWNIIYDNIITGNNQYGIYIDDVSKGNVVIWNRITENKVGVNCSGYSDGNLFHHNSFIENELNACDSSFDRWDDETEGNYWDDYTGIDEDGDGIGDTPYYIPCGDNKDRYPLMNPPVSKGKLSQLHTKTNKQTHLDSKNNEGQPTNSCSNCDIIVPTDYPTIQEAVDAAINGNTICVRAGTYDGHILVDKPLTIVGDNPDFTVVDGGGEEKHVFKVTADDVEITGFTIRNCGAGASGIRLLGNSSNIHDNILSDCGGAVELYYANNIRVWDNMIIGNNLGVHVDSCSDCKIEGNTIMDNEFGIETGLSTIEIIDNIIEENIKWGLTLFWDSNGFVIKDNSISFNEKSGLKIFSSLDNIVEINTINNNGLEGIIVFKSTGNMFSDNEIEGDARYPVQLRLDSDGNYIENNKITTNFEYGIHLYHSDGNVIDGNDIMNNNNDDCIFLRYSNNNKITQNTFSYGGVSQNGDSGLRLQEDSENNQCYHNMFLNGCNAHDEFGNKWNDGIFSGNYWSGYTGSDVGNDGIGDSPYDIPGGYSEDIHPLIYYPWEPPNIPEKPDGIANGETGEKYTYTTKATDGNKYQIRYGWDWDGDKKIDELTRLYNSEEPASTSHTWDKAGTYEIAVVAINERGHNSVWSDPLSISIPKNNQMTNPFLLRFLERLIERFPLLARLLNIY
jgi:parallel beta-helix repeat protein